MLLATSHITAIQEKKTTLNMHKTDYYTVLPTVKERNPHLQFIQSRDSESMSLRQEYLKMLSNTFKATIFVETGTYLGVTTELASRYFSRVYTIELSQELYEQAQEKFHNNAKIRLYQGESAEILPNIINNFHEQAIVFLDAHFSLGNTAKGKNNTPIIDELYKIKQTGFKNHILIIDDIRMFYNPIAGVEQTFMEGYPSLHQIVDAILTINPEYQCAVLFDTLIAFPAHEHITVSQAVKAATMSRLYDGINYEIQDILQAELCIANTQAKEKNSLVNLGLTCVEEWSKAAGLSRHNALWYGLILLAHEEYAKAHAYLREAKIRGMNHWRIDWYIAMAEAQCFFAIK